MAFFSTSFILTSLLVLPFTITNAQSSIRPRAFVLPVRKDASTLQYVTTINQRTPRVPVRVVVHLGGQSLECPCALSSTSEASRSGVDCGGNYVSSSYRPSRCRSAQCSLAQSTSCGECTEGPRPGCNTNTCSTFPDNPFIRTTTFGELAQDAISVPSTDGSNPGPSATAPRLIFTCGSTGLLDGLARNASGLLGLGRARIGVPEQLSAAFSFKRKFALCLSSSKGAVFFGDGPYNLLPNVDASDPLTYTPLFINPISTASAFTTGEKSTDYFIRVKSIRVNGNPIKINDKLLTIDSEGYGGTKISTADPYTVLEGSIYRAFTSAYVREATKLKITRASSVTPFEYCFSTKNIASTRVGPAVPSIDLVLQGEKDVWTITGSNSMVQVRKGVMCLGFLDGGTNTRTSIVIGGYQFEDNLLQFDLASSRLGFSSTLLGRRTTCANFNFTSSG